MKLLSALILSLGLSCSVWADDEAANAELELWTSTLTGLFQQSCDQFNETVKAFDGTALSGRSFLTPQFVSFINGINYNTFITKSTWTDTEPNRIYGYADITKLENPDIIFDAVSAKCRMNPQQAMLNAFEDWLIEYLKLQNQTRN